jgi:hypothetical protein
VLPAARMLAAAGVRLACLTNGSASLTAGFVQRAGAIMSRWEQLCYGRQAESFKPGDMIRL